MTRSTPEPLRRSRVAALRLAPLVSPTHLLLLVNAAALFVPCTGLEARSGALPFALLGGAALVFLGIRIHRDMARLETALAEASSARDARAEDLRRLQAILDAMTEGVLFIDADDKLALVNKAAGAMRGIGRDEGRPVAEYHQGAAHEGFRKLMGYLRHGDRMRPAPPLVRSADGRYETSLAPVRAPDGTYRGSVMLIRDIAERQSLERRLQDAERLAGLGRMAAQIAHELRNPLNAIGGAGEYLRRKRGEDQEIDRFTALVASEVERVNRFVSELLTIARPSEPAFVRTQINEIATLAAEKAALARGLEAGAVQLELAPGLPELDVDPHMMVAALSNLLANAFEAGGAEPPTLATRYEREGGSRAIVLSVSDRGCGIPPDRVADVLRPFVTTKAHGTGLGLVVVMNAAEQHKARFELSARPGGGTVASLCLSLMREADVGEEARR